MVDIITKKPNPITTKAKGTGKPVKSHEYIAKKMKALNRLDIEDFNNVADIGLFLDHQNNMVKRKQEEEGDAEIHEISKFLARMVSRKSFLTGGNKV